MIDDAGLKSVNFNPQYAGTIHFTAAHILNHASTEHDPAIAIVVKRTHVESCGSCWRTSLALALRAA